MWPLNPFPLLVRACTDYIKLLFPIRRKQGTHVEVPFPEKVKLGLFRVLRHDSTYSLLQGLPGVEVNPPIAHCRSAVQLKEESKCHFLFKTHEGKIKSCLLMVSFIVMDTRGGVLY